MRNSDSAAAVFFEHVIRHTLSSLTNNVDIHSVGTRAENTSETGCAELKASVEALVNLFIVSFYLSELLGDLSVLIRFFKPELIILHIIHNNSPPIQRVI